ncbi:MAG: OmpA family protein [Paracoccaceae bacterium]
MLRHRKTLLAAASVLTLTACSDATVFQSWNKEAGSQIDEGGFGNPTMNNTLVQNGERSYLVNLNQRFTNDVPTMINFAFDSTAIDADAQAVLMKQADWIRQFPEVRFKVFGHTDLVGSDAYNKRLGLRRAQAVVAFLSTQGISRSRLEAVVSFGETQPLIATSDRERRNRRTVTEVSGFVRNHPTLLHGKYATVIFRDYVRSASERQVTGQSELADTGGG